MHCLQTVGVCAIYGARLKCFNHQCDLGFVSKIVRFNGLEINCFAFVAIEQFMWMEQMLPWGFVVCYFV